VDDGVKEWMIGFEGRAEGHEPGADSRRRRCLRPFLHHIHHRFMDDLEGKGDVTLRNGS